MTRIALASLVLALAAASTAQAQYYDDRGYGYDGVYADQDDRFYPDYRGRTGPEYDTARVLSVEPIVDVDRQPTQYQQCYEQPAPAYAYDDGYGRYDDRYDDRYRGSRTSGGGALIGAIVGGALGNQVGDGDGRRAATVLGAVIGAGVGNDIERQNNGRRDAYYRDDRYDDRYGRNDGYADGYAGAGVRCETVGDYRAEEQVVGYRVNYEYAGRTYQTVTDYHPGSELRVRVEVTPEG